MWGSALEAAGRQAVDSSHKAGDIEVAPPEQVGTGPTVSGAAVASPLGPWTGLRRASCAPRRVSFEAHARPPGMAA